MASFDVESIIPNLKSESFPPQDQNNEWLGNDGFSLFQIANGAEEYDLGKVRSYQSIVSAFSFDVV